MSSVFEVYKDKRGKFRFRLKGEDGGIIAVGETFASKQDCFKGIDSLRNAAANSPILEVIKKVAKKKPVSKKKK
jgi:uncharacterized protein YegP (UPF0339 family)